MRCTTKNDPMQWALQNQKKKREYRHGKTTKVPYCTKIWRGPYNKKITFSAF